MRKSFLFFTVVFVGFTSCSQYEKLRKSSDYQLKYRKAFEYYEKGDYVRSGQLFDDVASVFRGTNKTDTVSYYQAMSYFHQRDYLTASYYFSQHYKNSPQSPFSEECEYLTGYCYYMQSPRPELDQDMTYSAIETFEVFLIRHPNSEYAGECAQLMGEMKDKLVDKSYLTATLYYNLGQYKASIIALNNSLGDYPETKYREELMFLLLKSSYLLAANSVVDRQKERYQSTVDEYYSFAGEFPKSSYAREALQMYERADRYLKARGGDEQDDE
jgi:outer membrane protein assembly factor BamD